MSSLFLKKILDTSKAIMFPQAHTLKITCVLIFKKSFWKILTWGKIAYKYSSTPCAMTIVVVQSLSRVWLFATPWTAACQASLSFTISRSLLNLMSIESMMTSNHLILCHPFSSCPQSFPASGSFPVSRLLTSGGHSIGASASVLPINIQGWFPIR